MILRVDIGPRSLRSCVETTILNLVYYYRPTTWVFERDFMRVRPPLGVTVLLQSLWYYFLGRIFGETSSRRNGVWRRRSARVSAGRKRAIKALPPFFLLLAARLFGDYRRLAFWAMTVFLAVFKPLVVCRVDVRLAIARWYAVPPKYEARNPLSRFWPAALTGGQIIGP
jgi:hypothetical protein